MATRLIDGVDFLTPQQTADFLGMSRDWLMQKKDEWRVPYLRLGGRIVFRRKDIQQWLESRVENAPTTK